PLGGALREPALRGVPPRLLRVVGGAVGSVVGGLVGVVVGSVVGGRRLLRGVLLLAVALRSVPAVLPLVLRLQRRPALLAHPRPSHGVEEGGVALRLGRRAVAGVVEAQFGGGELRPSVVAGLHGL